MPSAKKYKERREKGLCVYCGSKKEDDRFASCDTCRIAKREKGRIRRREQRKYLLENHKCVRCFKDMDEGWNYTACPECKEKDRVYALNKQKERRNNHQCLACSKPMEMSWKYAYCPECKEKTNKRNKEDREFYLSIRICPYCRKEKLFGDEIVCLECAAKDYERQIKNHKPMTREQKDRKNEKARLKRIRLAEEGICVDCWKRKAAFGRKRCEICLIKHQETMANRREKKPFDERERRKENGLCLWCTKPVIKNKCFCQTCYDKLCEHLADNRDKYNTGEYNRRFFVRRNAKN